MAIAFAVNYYVVMKNTDVSKKEIEEMVYHQSYNYYGFGGTVKVPATKFYAKKFANHIYDNVFIAKNLNTNPSEALADKLERKKFIYKIHYEYYHVKFIF